MANPMTAATSSARTPSKMSTRVSRSDMSMAFTVPPGAGERDPRDYVGGFRLGGARPPTQVRRRADLRSGVGARHEDVFAPPRGSSRRLEGEQAVEEGAIASECQPQIFGAGLFAV